MEKGEGRREQRERERSTTRSEREGRKQEEESDGGQESSEGCRVALHVHGKHHTPTLTLQTMCTPVIGAWGGRELCL